MEISRNWSLREIADWTSVQSIIKIPALQRGLVWKPRQVELLWDSILRQFPIGSFLLSKNTDESYDLMDGQQRFNAIATAFAQLNDNSQSELWIDIDPPQTNTTRFFWIKATTIAHPWGFKNDDDCHTLGASERRQALCNFKKNAQFNIYKKNNENELTLSESFPFAAKSPIPIQYLLSAASCETNDLSFAENVIDQIKKSNRNFADYFDYTNGLSKIASFYQVFKNIENYKVHSNVIDTQSINIEGNNVEDASNLEVLFNRLNSNGTPITAAELKYSAIKAYWPDIRDMNNQLANGYMSPEKLVLILFKLALTELERSSKNEPSIKQIRNYAKDSSIKQAIQNEYSSCSKYFEIINEWLDINETVNSTPQIIRSRIINKSSDLFFLLLFIAKHNKECSKKTIKAIVFYMHFFGNVKFQKSLTDKFIQSFFSNPSGTSLENIFYREIANYVYAGNSIFTYRHDIKLDANPISDNTDKWFSETITLPEAQQAFHSIQQNKDILLYAQREFLNTFFDKYLSESGNTWEDHNVPWDYDHIIPQEWINSQRGGSIPFCKKWLNSIGNLAAIPYEVNRSKSNNGDWNFYQNYSSTLFFDENLINEKIAKNGLKNKNSAITFANYTLQRLQKIYEQLDSVLQPLNFENILISSSDSKIIKRYQLFMNVEKCFGEPLTPCYYDGTKDVEITHPLHWCSKWISIGYKLRNKYFISIVSQDPSADIEIGIRKINSEDSEVISFKDYTTFDDNKFWFIHKYIPGNTSALEIVKELKELKGCTQ